MLTMPIKSDRIKSCFLFLAFVLVCSPAFAQRNPKNQVRIQGKLRLKDQVDMVYLTYRSDGARKSDSTRPRRGRFRFAANVGEPAVATVRLRFAAPADGDRRQDESRQLLLYRGAVQLDIRHDMESAQIRGAGQDDLQNFLQLIGPFDAENAALREQYRQLKQSDNRQQMRAVGLKQDDVRKAKSAAIYSFLLNHPKTVIGMYALNMYAGEYIDVAQAEPVYNNLLDELRTSPSGLKFAQRMQTIKNTRVGALAPDFIQNDTSGMPVSLSDFKGRYVLLEFWGSWCYPCRQENPHVVKAYNTYKDRNFTVLSIGIEMNETKEAWLQAIKKDELTWTHVSDFRYFKNEVALLYGINAVPYSFLIDPEGRIIAKNLRGKGLAAKLQELFD